MASEIAVNQRITATKGSITRTRNRSFNADWTTATYAGTVQSIPTTAAGTALAFTGVTTGGWAYFINNDATNYVEIGVQTGGTTFLPLVKLLPGEMALLRLAVLTVFARANTAAVLLEYEALNS
jgi:hypothetical protein